MAEDSEKRFHSIMDKLFQDPKSTLESTPPSRGQKRMRVSPALRSKEPSPKLEVAKKLKHFSSHGGTSDVPLCRPWDRDDLMKRLGTFKSMSWFAKPKVVSAVNCARWGWINVDMDMIACESCRAQLFFSTPSSWNQQQVEKAALAFSLKLENGHKLLCPWIDNACDEALADFPPTPAPALVDKFRERCSKLVRVFALPLVSTAAIEYMRNHKVEQFLENSLVPEFGDGSVYNSEAEYLRKEHDSESAKLYHQALKLISLCGWEPRSLPYIVEFKDGSNHSVTAVTTLEYRKNSNAQSTGNDYRTMGDVKTSCRLQPDLGSVVLDCKLCGASVGMWTFRTVLKPLEIFRLVGPTDEGTNDDRPAHDSCNEDQADNMKDARFLLSSDVNSSNSVTSLNTTIAGGPPPTRQNFKATISLPVASTTLGDWLMSGSDSVDSDPEEDLISKYLARPIEEDIKEACRMFGLIDEQQYLEFFGKHIRSCGSLHPNGLELSIQNDENILQDLPQNDKSPISAEKGPENFPELEPSSSQIVEKDNQISEDISSLSSQAAPCAETCYGDCFTQEKTALPRQSNARDFHASTDKAGEFDPIKQHRYFCPWIASTNNCPSGWQQTLSAILRKKDFSSSSPCNFRSSSIIKVDDPVMSVRKLFTLSAKKLRQSLASDKTI